VQGPDKITAVALRGCSRRFGSYRKHQNELRAESAHKGSLVGCQQGRGRCKPAPGRRFL